VGGDDEVGAVRAIEDVYEKGDAIKVDNMGMGVLML
jgi:hypothetical protein